MATNNYFYYGCFNDTQVGHHWTDEDGYIRNANLPINFVQSVKKYPTSFCSRWDNHGDSANPQPLNACQIQGECLVTHITDTATSTAWTVLATWDRTVDTRFNSVSVFVLIGTLNFSTCVTTITSIFPSIKTRFNTNNITLVEFGPTEIDSSCIQALTFGTAITTSVINPPCLSTYNNTTCNVGAKYFTFTLSRQSTVTVVITTALAVTAYVLSGSPGSTTLTSFSPLAGTGTISETGILDTGSYTVELQNDINAVGNVSIYVDICDYQVSLNTITAGTLRVNCRNHTATGYAKYYQFTLSSTTNVEIGVSSSAFDPFVYLYSGNFLAGNGPSGSLLASNDNSGGGTTSQIIQSLPAGNYTIEITGLSSGTGAFSLSLEENLALCDASIVLDDPAITSSLSSSCLSVKRTSSVYYSKFYTFTLVSDVSVAIALSSGSFNPHMILMYGAGHTGNIITEITGNGSSANNLNVGLVAGTYTIEVSTEVATTTGSFTVGLTTSIVCDLTYSVNDHSSGPLVNGLISSSCSADHTPSAGTFYAKYYTFTLTHGRACTINIISAAFNPRIYILNDDRSGSLVNSYVGTAGTLSVSRLRLDGGTYCIEVTSNTAAQTGSFTIEIDTDYATPPEIDSISFWFEADVGVATSGSTVTNWVSQDGGSSGYKLVPSGSPTYSASGFGSNSKPYVNLTGTNYFQLKDSGNLTNFGLGNSVFTIFFVYSTASSNDQTLYFTGTQVGGEFASSYMRTSNTDASIYLYAKNTNTSTSGTSSKLAGLNWGNNGTYIVAQTWNGTNASHLLWKNGALVSLSLSQDTTVPTPFPADNAQPFMIGTLSSGGASSAFIGKLAEIVVYANKGLSNDRMFQVFDYLNNKYSIY